MVERCRSPAHTGRGYRAGSTGLALLALVACDPAVIAGSDAGGRIDAGLDAGRAADAQVVDHPPADLERVDAALEAGAVDAAADAGTGADATTADAGTADAVTACPSTMTCVDSFPFGQDRDSSAETLSAFDVYGCASSIDESGPEIVYRVTLTEAGFLSAAVYEASGVDVDVHLLSVLDPQRCLARGNFGARADVGPGVHYVVVDTYVAGGVPRAGAFHVDIGFFVPSRGACELQVGSMARVNDSGDSLPMPATGPIVLEAHLVTQQEPAPYPSTSTDELAEHHALSQGISGYVMYRTQDWAPLEGGDFYGCGIGAPEDFPTLHEAWYVNMYWRSTSRPAKGTRMILRLPGTSRAVVVAAGYETGPGDLAHVGGTPEETHDYLGTGHLDAMTIGIAVDQGLPFGPRTCD